ncbi:MAG: type II toxin-antitoxin system Phd/YefM family antitoxin [Acidobacteriota bacterium]
MKTLAIEKARRSLSRYARATHDDSEPLVVTDGGTPIAALVPLDGVDVESLSLGSNPEFIRLIEHARKRAKAGAVLTAAEVRQRVASRRAKRS